MPDAMRGSADLAGIFYTGGTTGRSKGVMLSHGNLTANAFNALGEGLFPGTATYLHAARCSTLLTARPCGASPISEAVLGRAMAALPNVQFTQAYGMTELSPIATLLHWNEYISQGRAKGRHRSAGRPRSAAKFVSSIRTTGRCPATRSAK